MLERDVSMAATFALFVESSRCFKIDLKYVKKYTVFTRTEYHETNEFCFPNNIINRQPGLFGTHHQEIGNITLKKLISPACPFRRPNISCIFDTVFII